MFDITNEFEIIKYKLEQAHKKQLLPKKFPIKVIQYFISTVNTYKQEMIEFGIENICIYQQR